MHKPSAYKHNVPAFQTTILLAVLLAPILFGAFKGGSSKSAKELSGYQQVEASWEQTKNKWCGRRADALLIKVQAAGSGFAEYERAMANCELDFYESYPRALQPDNGVPNPSIARIRAELQKREDARNACVASLKEGYEAGRNGQPRSESSGAFAQGFDIGSLHGIYGKQLLEARLENASSACRDV